MNANGSCNYFEIFDKNGNGNGNGNDNDNGNGNSNGNDDGGDDSNDFQVNIAAVGKRPVEPTTAHHFLFFLTKARNLNI